MDYGGHDSIYENNLVIGFPQRTSCVGFGSFQPGHGHIVHDNRCIVPNLNKPIIEIAACGKNSNTVLQRNHYYGPSLNVTVRCGYSNDPIHFADAQRQYASFEEGSTIDTLPTNEEILKWANETLYSTKGTHSKGSVIAQEDS